MDAIFDTGRAHGKSNHVQAHRHGATQEVTHARTVRDALAQRAFGVVQEAAGNAPLIGQPDRTRALPGLSL
jgi:hypothetical protein